MTEETRTELPLACSVRGCGAPLLPRAAGLVCPAGHSFDRARSGYVSLLQPQDRRSTAAGDARAALAARSRLVAAGGARGLQETLAQAVRALAPAGGSVVADLGTGGGEILAALAGAFALRGIGLDLSPRAVEHAARRFPEHTWIVANADRRLPLLDGRVALVLSIHGRRNPAECARVLAPGGRLIVALPAEDDLVELRARVQGRALQRERVEACLAAHAAHFKLESHRSARERRACTRAELLDLLAGTYRGERQSAAEAVAGLASLEVTLASEVLVLAPLARGACTGEAESPAAP